MSPFQFRKIDGIWHRRETDTNNPWQRLVIIPNGNKPAEPRRDWKSRNKNKIAPPPTNIWKWKTP